MPGKIGTHNGKFHCDEAFACFMLTQLNEFKDYEIIRTRDPAVLKDCDLVVDVGGVFDHASGRYDHHQKEFVGTMSSLSILPFSTKLSSAGLVYAHYGKKLIAQKLTLKDDDALVGLLYKRLYQTFVEAIDGVDNGIPAYEGLPRYQPSSGISGRVGHLNPHWNQPDVDPDARFKQAMALVGGEFLEALEYLHGVWWPARSLVIEAVEKRKQNDPSGRIICLGNGGVPWKEHFFDIEEEKGLLNERITYIVFGEKEDWRVQAIPNDRLSSFDNRLGLPAAWRGLRDSALSEISGIENCVFVHTTGFIGGNKSKEGAIQMAKEALRIGDSHKDNEQIENGVKRARLDEEGTVSVQA